MDKNKRIKICVIGCGKISKKHFEAIDNLKNYFILVGVCDVNSKNLIKVKKLFDIKIYSDYLKMIKELKPDIVTLATPNGLHFKQTLSISKTKTHIISEKPLALNLKQANKMIQTCKKYNVNLFVVLQLRFNKNLIMIKEFLDKKKLGKIYFGNMNIFWSRPQMYYDSDIWRGSKKMDGGTFLNQAIHYVDLLSWFFGKVKSLSSYSGRLARKIDFEDTGAIIFNFKSKIIATLNLSMLTYKKSYETSLTLIGSRGTLKVSGKDLSKIEYLDYLGKKTHNKSIIKKQINNTSNHEEFYRNIAFALKGKKNSAIYAKDSLESLKIIDAMYLSNKKKKNINL